MNSFSVCFCSTLWSKISNALKRLRFRSRNFLAQLLSETSREFRLLLSEGEKATLAEIAHRLGREVLEHLAATTNPDTILGWYRKLAANKSDGSKFRRRAGRPRMNEELERLVVQMAKENPGWCYDRIVGAMANQGHQLSDQTVGTILRRHGLSPAPKRKQVICWRDFIRSHMEVLVGTDFFTVEVLTLKALVTYYVLFFMHLESRRVSMTRCPYLYAYAASRS
jgi:putative transposase